MEEHSYFNSGGHKSDLYYYTLGGRLLGALDNSGKTTFYLTDALGSVLSSFSNVATSAAIKGNQVFGPYGNARDLQGTINTAKGFTGQYNDSLTGLDYYGSRYYDQVAGVFLSADVTQGNMQGMNPYAYVGGNPETRNDPSGQVGLPPVTTQPPATSNPFTWPKLEIPPEAPVAACYFLCPSLGVVAIASVLAIGLFLATPETLDPGELVHFGLPTGGRSPDLLNDTGSAIGINIQPHTTPQPQTGSGGQGVIPPLPTATAGGFCSFASDTQVTTEHGEKVISKLHVGDKVLAYNPKTHKVELQPILHVWTHNDHDLIDLTITLTVSSHHGTLITHQSDVVHTTSEHPFLTKEQGFVPAGMVKVGMHILRADGRIGVIIGRKMVAGTRVMYNLEIAQDHTFTVGDGQWVVHNDCGGQLRENMINAGRIFNPEEQVAHHIIPCQLQHHPLVEKAIEGGFDMNGIYNGRAAYNADYAFRVIQESQPEPYQAGNHPEYTAKAERMLWEKYWELEYAADSMSGQIEPADAYNTVMNVIDALNTFMDVVPGCLE